MIVSECAESAVRSNRPVKAGSRQVTSGGVGGSPVLAISAFRERPVRAHRPVGRKSLGPVIPGLVGKHTRDCRSGTAPVRKNVC